MPAGSLYTVADGQDALGEDVQQIIRALTGITTGAGSGTPLAAVAVNSTSYAVDAMNLGASGHTGSRAFRARDASGNIIARMGSFGTTSTPNDTIGSYFSLPVVIGNVDLQHVNNTLTVRKFDYSNPVAGQSYVPILSEIIIANQPTDGFGGSTSIPDSGAITAVMRVVGTAYGASQNGDAAVRAGEFHTFLYDGAGKRTAASLELGTGTAVAITSHADNPGAYDTYFGAGGVFITSNTGSIGAGYTAGQACNYGVLMYGDAGFKNYLLCYGTDQVTKMLQVSQVGQMILRNRILAQGDGTATAGAPTYTTETDTDTGDYPVGANQWGTSTGGTLRGTWSSSGLAIVNGLTVAQNHVQTGFITPAQITGNTNDYAPTGLATARTLRLTTDAPRDLTGIVAQPNGTLLRIMNVGSFNLVLKNGTTSAAANQFGIGGDVTLATNQTLDLIYDTNIWRPA